MEEQESQGYLNHEQYFHGEIKRRYGMNAKMKKEDFKTVKTWKGTSFMKCNSKACDQTEEKCQIRREYSKCHLDPSATCVKSGTTLNVLALEKEILE